MDVLKTIEEQQKLGALQKGTIFKKLQAGEQLTQRERAYWILFMATDEEVKEFIDKRDKQQEVAMFLKRVWR